MKQEMNMELSPPIKKSSQEIKEDAEQNPGIPSTNGAPKRSPTLDAAHTIIVASLAWAKAWGKLWEGNDSDATHDDLNNVSKSLYDAICDYERSPEREGSSSPTFILGVAPLYTQADFDRMRADLLGSQYRKFLDTHDECVECGNAACRGTELFPMRIDDKVEARCWECLKLKERWRTIQHR